MNVCRVLCHVTTIIHVDPRGIQHVLMLQVFILCTSCIVYQYQNSHLCFCLKILTYEHKSAIPRFGVESLPKIFDFGYFALMWWQSDNKQ